MVSSIAGPVSLGFVTLILASQQRRPNTWPLPSTTGESLPTAKNCHWFTMFRYVWCRRMSSFRVLTAAGLRLGQSNNTALRSPATATWVQATAAPSMSSKIRLRLSCSVQAQPVINIHYSKRDGRSMWSGCLHASMLCLSFGRNAHQGSDSGPLFFLQLQSLSHEPPLCQSRFSQSIFRALQTAFRRCAR